MEVLEEDIKIVSVKSRDIGEGLDRCNTEIDTAMNIFNVSEVITIEM
jgi:hypothetical protein